jgi:hypothetical protein
MGDIFNIDSLPVPVQDLDETTHVSPLEVVRQVHIHIHGSDGVLSAIFLIQHRNGVADALHPDLIDFDVAVVFLILDIND